MFCTYDKVTYITIHVNKNPALIRGMSNVSYFIPALYVCNSQN